MRYVRWRVRCWGPFNRAAVLPAPLDPHRLARKGPLVGRVLDRPRPVRQLAVLVLVVPPPRRGAVGALAAFAKQYATKEQMDQLMELAEAEKSQP